VQEEEALRTGVAQGMTLIDTSEVYGEGAAEEVIARAIAGERDRVFLVSKVAPYNATSSGAIRRACTQTLRRLGTGHLDLYLLHWRSQLKRLDHVVETFEALKQEGMIRRWGVSNFGVRDMEDLFRIPGGRGCAANQVSYSVFDRSVERSLVPWCKKHGVALMAYSPLGSSTHFLHDPFLNRVAAKHGVTAAVVAIAWTMRDGCTISIPESGSPQHAAENAAAMGLALDAEDLASLDRMLT
jgi:diketogulonate reductase-like aldo/keto reductase